ncbi:DUF3327 domain-containing protein [Microbacterium sp. W1N]|uniref:enterochelin esterase domain-containing protein n=1 Tax=Microbacterium festucae TaxID=2977531 RepID=UPI0021BE9814|nr:enterochelin esterase domain-containing protein [Microbacterium festucae]MCT9818947.1 DUF3327 domain-containing protein [Microbacterium festucae]
MPSSPGPRFGPLVAGAAGVAAREVTFVWRPEAPTDDEVLLVLAGVTDPTALDPVLLRRDGDEWTCTLLLPDDLVAGYGFASAPRIPRDAGDDFFAWVGVLQSAVPDPAVGERIPDQLGGTASVLRMPGSRCHPAERADAAPLRRFATTALDLGDDGVATVLVPDTAARRLLILFDAENQRQLPVEADLARHPFGDTSVLLLPSGDPYRRFRTLPDRGAVAAWTDRAITAGQRAGALPHDLSPADVTAAGQSYGALAAAGLVVDGRARAAILQSGSFEQRADTPAGEEADRPGDLVEALATTRLDARLVVQHGTLEPHASRLAAQFAAAARGAGAAVTARAYRGGHDYAWWRTGLLDALDALSPADPAAR